MNTLRWALLIILCGSICIVASLVWPEIPDPRERWTEEKSAEFSETGQEIHSLSHVLTDEIERTERDPNHVHPPGETTDPRVAALELERARERSDELRAELEAARKTPAGYHLLLGLVGGVLVIAGGVMAVASLRHS
jgi:hypothetical protein